MEHLAQRHAAERRVDEIVERGLIRLAEVLPGAAAKRGDSRRLPEVHAVGASAVEIVIALIRVADLVDGEVVEVPLPSSLHVLPPRLRCDFGGVLSADQVCGFVKAIDDGGPREGFADPTRWTARAGTSLVVQRWRRGGKLNRGR